MHIGLIGGIGPAATVAYYTRLVEEFKRHNLPLKLTIAHADITTLAANATAGNREAQAEVFNVHLRELESAGCNVATITALTGHFCFEETQHLSPIPLINAIDVVDKYCEAHDVGTLGLLGSPPVLKTQLFGLLRAPKTVVPTDDLEGLGQTYMDIALSGTCSEEQRQRLFSAGARMVSDQNAEAVLLAGTDLGLAFTGFNPGYKVIDALELHVAAMVSLASAT
ncbi:MAG: aspartate/glutamate racemase family protein [Hyphomicrobiales bacterium]